MIDFTSLSEQYFFDNFVLSLHRLFNFKVSLDLDAREIEYVCVREGESVCVREGVWI